MELNYTKIKELFAQYENGECSFEDVLKELQSARLRVSRENVKQIKDYIRREIIDINLNHTDDLCTQVITIDVHKPRGLKEVVTVRYLKNFETIDRSYIINL
jgi:hypothetical protein